MKWEVLSIVLIIPRNDFHFGFLIVEFWCCWWRENASVVVWPHSPHLPSILTCRLEVEMRSWLPTLSCFWFHQLKVCGNAAGSIILFVVWSNSSLLLPLQSASVKTGDRGAILVAYQQSFSIPRVEGVSEIRLLDAFLREKVPSVFIKLLITNLYWFCHSRVPILLLTRKRHCTPHILFLFGSACLKSGGRDAILVARLQAFSIPRV